MGCIYPIVYQCAFCSLVIPCCVFFSLSAFIYLIPLYNRHQIIVPGILVMHSLVMVGCLLMQPLWLMMDLKGGVIVLRLVLKRYLGELHAVQAII